MELTTGVQLLGRGGVVAVPLMVMLMIMSANAAIVKEFSLPF